MLWAASWHGAWGLLLVPYSLCVTVLLDGTGSIQSWSDSLAIGFVVWFVYLVVALPLNVGVAVLAKTILGGRTAQVRWVGTVAAYTVVWFVAIQFLLPVVYFTGGLQFDSITLWAASAGALYGLGLLYGGERMTATTPTPA